MRTAPAFAENPVGDFFDAEAVYQDHLDGMPSDQIRTGISNGAYAPTKAPNLRLPRTVNFVPLSGSSCNVPQSGGAV